MPSVESGAFLPQTRLLRFLFPGSTFLGTRMAHDTGLYERTGITVVAAIIAATVAIRTSSSQDLPLNTPPITTPLLRASVAVDKVSDSGATPVGDLARTDDKLKKMEEELLKTLGSQAPQSVTETPTGAGVARLKIPPIQAPKEAFPEPSSDNEGAAMLKRLEEHPALEGTPRTNVPSGGRTKAPRIDPNIDLGHKLEIAESQVSILSRELDTTRRSLRSAESRIQELSALVRSTAAKPEEIERSPVEKELVEDRDVPDDSGIEPYWPGSHTVPIPAGDAENSVTSGNRYGSDTAVVAVDRAPLRIGPGRLESTLFLIPRNAHIQVERRSGEWYRVMTSSGTRGWIYGNSLLFDQGTTPDSAVRIGPARPSYEPTGLRY